MRTNNATDKKRKEFEMKKELKPTPLNEAKIAFKKIEQFVKKRPTPSEYDVTQFLIENELEKYTDFAISLQIVVSEKEWILYQNKQNKYR